MEAVVDASAVLAVLLDEPEKAKLVEVTQKAELVAPDCLEYEIGNAMSALMKRNAVSVTDAVAVYHEFVKIPLRTAEVDIPYAMVLAGEDGIYAYDAYYLACAIRMRLPLLTLDRKLAACAAKRGIICLL